MRKIDLRQSLGLLWEIDRRRPDDEAICDVPVGLSVVRVRFHSAGPIPGCAGRFRPFRGCWLRPDVATIICIAYVRAKAHPATMKTLLLGLSLALALSTAGFAQSVNGNIKATFQTSYIALLGPFATSTGGTGPITSPWTTILEQDLKTANNWDLVIVPSFEVGLLTSTSVSSKNMITDVTTASASVKVRVLIDGVQAAPGEITYGKRTQTLSATLEGAIAACLSIVTNASGALTIVLDPTCVSPETIGLLEDTVSANSFTFVAPNQPVGVHRIQIQAQIAVMGNAQNGTFTAAALLNKGTMTVESSRTLKTSPQPYVLGN